MVELLKLAPMSKLVTEGFCRNSCVLYGESFNFLLWLMQLLIYD